MIKELMFSQRSINRMARDLPIIALTLIASFIAQDLINDKLSFFKIMAFAFFSLILVVVLFIAYALLAMFIRRVIP